MTISEDLQHYLQQCRDSLVGSLDGLSEHDVRRPMTPTGTNLLGLIKHLIGVEAVYLGDSVGRPSPLTLPWNDDGSVWEDGDLWARADESRDYILDLYRAGWAHSDASIAELPLDAPASVPHWAEDRRSTTFGHLLARTLGDTAQHAGHADILREMIDPASARDPEYGDAAYWDNHVAQVQAAADLHR